MKKFLIIIAVLVGAYFVIAGALKVSGVCSKSINLMPGIVGSGSPEDKGMPAWYIFCPFSKKVY